MSTTKISLTKKSTTQNINTKDINNKNIRTTKKFWGAICLKKGRGEPSVFFVQACTIKGCREKSGKSGKKEAKFFLHMTIWPYDQIWPKDLLRPHKKYPPKTEAELLIGGGTGNKSCR